MSEESPEQRAYDAQLRLAEKQHERHSENFLKINEAAIQAAQGAVRNLLVINGGAAVAVLAFIGTIAAKDKISIPQLTNVANSLVFFVFGVVAAVFTGMTTYLTHFSGAAFSASHTFGWEHPFINRSVKTKTWQIIAIVAHGSAILAATVSLTLFVFGAFEVKNSIALLK